MIISIGSKNSVKVDALKETLREYDMFSGAIISSHATPSNISEQPKSLEETMRGAKNRARGSAITAEASLGFGLESGLIEVPNTNSGMMDLCACAIYIVRFDQWAFGLSSAFECPPEITRLAMEEGIDLNEACVRVGLTTNPSIGNFEGIIGLLSKGKVNRKRYTKQAIRMALIHLQ